MNKNSLYKFSLFCIAVWGSALPLSADAQNKLPVRRSVVDTLNLAITDQQNPDVGYLGVKRQPSIGAVTAVPDNRIKGLYAQSIGALLQAQAAGVHVVNTSGAPGSGALINIRGVSTLNGGTTPLFIVDGVPVKSIRIKNPLALNADNDPLTDINPEDIASVTVLKDAYATAPYGVRGAIGVVIINTYGGTTG